MNSIRFIVFLLVAIAAMDSYTEHRHLENHAPKTTEVCK